MFDLSQLLKTIIEGSTALEQNLPATVPGETKKDILLGTIEAVATSAGEVDSNKWVQLGAIITDVVVEAFKAHSVNGFSPNAPAAAVPPAAPQATVAATPNAVLFGPGPHQVPTGLNTPSA